MLAAVLLLHHAVAVDPLYVGVPCGGDRILANTTTGVNVTVDRWLYAKVDCDLALDLAARMPELCLEFFDLTDATGVDAGWSAQNAYFASMLNNLKQRNNSLEIFRMKGMEGLSEHLLPIDEATVNISDKYLMKNKAGQVVAYSEEPSQYVIYYNKRFFDDFNVSLPTNASTWEEWEEALLLLQTRRRADLQKCCKENGKCPCGDPNDFYALGIPQFQRVIQQERWLHSSYATNFFSMLLGSGSSKEKIIDNDGNVTVNTPQAVKTLKMWQRWYETIVKPSTDSLSSKWRDKDIAVVIDFNNLAAGYSSRFIETVMEPIVGPGATAATDPVWVGVSKYVRHPEIALELINLMSLYPTTKVLAAGPPVDERVVNGTKLYKSWCNSWYSENYLTCRAYEKNPAYWSRPFVSLGHHCGENKLVCNAVVYDYLMQSLRGQVPAEVALEQLTTDLTGHLVQPVTNDNAERWTTEFTFLVVAAVVGSIAFFALMFLAWGLVRPLRSSGTLVLPLPVVLSLCMMVILGVEIGVATNYSSNTSKEISKSLALKLRTETLVSVKNAVIPQLEHVLETVDTQGNQEPKAGKLARMRAGLAVTTGLLKLQKGVLVTVLDRADGTVLGSSNEWVQRVGASLMEGNNYIQQTTAQRGAAVLEMPAATSNGQTLVTSPWLAGVPMAVPNWQNITNEETAESYSTSVGGETVLFSIQVITHKGLDLLVVYFVPEEVILGKANDDVEKLIYMSAGLAVLAVVAVAAVAVVSTLPLVTLSRDMEAVRVMRVEEVMSGKGSRLAEMNALLLGFHGMVDMLIEYKSYMPKTLFMKEDSDEHLDSASEKKSESRSARSGGTSKSTRASISTPSVVESVGHGPQLDKLNVSEGCVVRVRVVGLHEMLEKTSRASNVFMDLLSAAEHVSDTYRACLHTFSAVEPGDFVLSWGVVSGGIPHRERAARAALHLAEGRHVLAVTYIAGQCRSGNLGTSKTRGFGIVGRVMEECGRVSGAALDMAAKLGKSVVLCNEGVQRKLMNELQVELVDLLGGLRSALRRVFRVIRLREVDCQEWMYELEEQQRAAKHPANLCLEEVAKGKDLNAAVVALMDMPKSRDDFGLNTLIASRLEEIKGMKINVLSVPSLFMQTSFVPHVKK
eukprot:TRINITY_DN258_c0_g1_i11.p1 TRINITY_DN258_c0_g1~~TRINITY_DN258_c0_g1_i11.p1  ORF type:complete len:1136 (+),score=277.53 TRINITY_DN258_c0_g1_i11:45-3452(+)